MKQRCVSKGVLLTALLLGTLQGHAVQATEADELQNFTLDQIVVTAQRVEKTDLETPASVRVLSQKEIMESGATQVHEALKFVVGITEYGFGPNGQAWGGMSGKALIRGNDKGTLVMIDGAPMATNNVYYLNTLPVEAVERIEIVKGASSVLYGSEAAGGVVNIITKKNMRSSISLSKGEYGKTREGLSLGLGKLGIVANFEQGEPLKGLASNGRVMNDGDKSSILWKYKFNDAWTLSHQHTVNDYHFDQYDTDTWSNLKENSHYKWKEDFARLRYDDAGWKGTVYYNVSDRFTDTLKPKKGIFKPYKRENIKFKTYGFDLQKTLNSKFADIVVGTTIEQQKYFNDIAYKSGKPVHNPIDEDLKTYALFMQVAKNLGSDLTLAIGAREQLFRSVNNYSDFTPEFSLLKKINDTSSLYLNANKAFKMPNFTALYGSGGDVFEGNPFLQPEEGWSYELGYKHITDTSSFKAALYYIDMNKAWDYISDAEGKLHPINAAFENKGLEVSYDKQMGNHLAYSVGADFSNPKSQVKGVWARRYARNQYSAGIKYYNRAFNAALNGSITADRAGGWPNKAPVNLTAGYQVDKNSRFDFACENLFNRKDIVGNWANSRSTEYYSLPRNIRVTYTYTF